MTYRCIFLSAVVWLCGFAPRASAQAWNPDKVWATGSDKSVWVVASGRSPDAQLPVIEMWYAGSKQTEAGLEKPSQSPSLAAQLGEVERLGADAFVLRVLFSNLDSTNYAIESSSLGGVLWTRQSDKPPLAWGGDASLGVFYAVVLTSQLKAPESQPAEEPDTQPAEGAAAEVASAAESVIESRVTCLRLRDGRWERIACPPQADIAETYWISGRDGSPFLFWRTTAGDVFFSVYDGGAWAKPETVGSRQEFAFARVGASKEGPVFIAATPAGDSRVNLRIHRREEGAWRDLAEAREGSELFAADPAGIDVGIARDHLVVARLAQDGRIEFGSGALGVSPPLAFDELKVRTPAPTGPDWQAIVVMVLVLACVTVLFWARRDMAANPLALPPGWMLAATWKRALAAVIDMVPALTLATVLMAQYMGDLMPEDPSAAFQMLNDPELISKALPISIAMWATYSLWCFFWELTTSTTPGKRLFGCRVFAIDGSRPGPKAVALRNITRAVLLSIGEPGILVILLTMVFLTRNRQRPGDLLAKTLVLEPRRELLNLDGRIRNDDRQDPPRE